MKIYLSGPITKDPDHREKFTAAEINARRIFPKAEILNPVTFCDDIPKDSSWDTFMERCVAQLRTATHIIMLDNWRESGGACCEYWAAKTINLSFL